MSLHHRLRRLIQIGVGVTSVAALSCGTALMLMIHDQDRVTEQYFKANRLAYQQAVVHTEMRTALRSYELTGDPERVRDYYLASEADDQIFTDLMGILVDQPALIAKVEQVHSQELSWRSRYGEGRIAYVRDHGSVALNTPLYAESMSAFEPIISSRNSLLQAVLDKRSEALTRLRYSTRLLGAALGVVMAMFFVALALLWRLLRVWVTDPIQQLSEEVAKVERGDLRHRIEAQGPQDIRELGHNIDNMREQIVAEYTAAVQARQVAESAQDVIAQQTQELARSNRDLEQFAYVASHDLQEPLRKISSFCQMIERRYHDQLDDRGRQYIDFAVDGAKRMQILINDLLAFSRVGRTNKSWGQVDLNQCFDHAVQVLDETIRTTDTQITHDYFPMISGEASLLTQLFQNLVGNAIKFHGEQPPHIHLGVREITQSTGEPMWQFYCRDNGIGIAPQFQDKIFAIFQRLHSKDEYPGTGIGLALCKKIVEYHGGHIWLVTETDQSAELRATNPGTEFAWTLPMQASNPHHLLYESGQLPVVHASVVDEASLAQRVSSTPVSAK